MDFELADLLTTLIIDNQLDEAIKLAEDKLLRLPPSDFHQILGKDLLHLTDELVKYLSVFIKEAKDDIEIKAIYAEMNGFTINPDLWFIDFFAYEQTGSLDDRDWLADYDYESDESMVISGFEDLQAVYKDYVENKKWKNEDLRNSSSICELLIILRLQELFRAAKKLAVEKNLEWKLLPVFATAHDYDLIYKM